MGFIRTEMEDRMSKHNYPVSHGNMLYKDLWISQEDEDILRIIKCSEHHREGYHRPLWFV